MNALELRTSSRISSVEHDVNKTILNRRSDLLDDVTFRTTLVALLGADDYDITAAIRAAPELDPRGASRAANALATFYRVLTFALPRLRLTPAKNIVAHDDARLVR